MSALASKALTYPVEALPPLLRAGDKRAEKQVVDALKRCNGNVTATAVALGCSVRALYNWRDSNPTLSTAFERLALGRSGAGPNATKARQKQRKRAKRL